MKILIVEDDKRLAQSIRMYLEKQGHQVQWVNNGKKALDVLEGNMHDGVISDVQMPGGNGIELLQASWRAFVTPPPFYVHSSEDTFYWAGDQWDLPEVIGSAFKDFAIFRSKRIPKMLEEIQTWLDDVESKMGETQ
jgi:DNA-binding LytR/AlgR family response regulator